MSRIAREKEDSSKTEPIKSGITSVKTKIRSPCLQSKIELRVSAYMRYFLAKLTLTSADLELHHGTSVQFRISKVL